jgi:hypothetical protein
LGLLAPPRVLGPTSTPLGAPCWSDVKVVSRALPRAAFPSLVLGHADMKAFTTPFAAGPFVSSCIVVGLAVGGEGAPVNSLSLGPRCPLKSSKAGRLETGVREGTIALSTIGHVGALFLGLCSQFPAANFCLYLLVTELGVRKSAFGLTTDKVFRGRGAHGRVFDWHLVWMTGSSSTCDLGACRTEESVSLP